MLEGTIESQQAPALVTAASGTAALPRVTSSDSLPSSVAAFSTAPPVDDDHAASHSVARDHSAAGGAGAGGSNHLFEGSVLSAGDYGDSECRSNAEDAAHSSSLPHRLPGRPDGGASFADGGGSDDELDDTVVAVDEAVASAAPSHRREAVGDHAIRHLEGSGDGLSSSMRDGGSETDDLASTGGYSAHSGRREDVERVHYVARLRRFYARYNPEKLNRVEEFLVAYRGEEEQLFTMLVSKYGPEPEAPPSDRRQGGRPAAGGGQRSLGGGGSVASCDGDGSVIGAGIVGGSRPPPQGSALQHRIGSATPPMAQGDLRRTGSWTTSFASGQPQPRYLMPRYVSPENGLTPSSTPFWPGSRTITDPDLCTLLATLQTTNEELHRCYWGVVDRHPPMGWNGLTYISSAPLPLVHDPKARFLGHLWSGTLANNKVLVQQKLQYHRTMLHCSDDCSSTSAELGPHERWRLTMYRAEHTPLVLFRVMWDPVLAMPPPLSSPSPVSPPIAPGGAGGTTPPGFASLQPPYTPPSTATSVAAAPQPVAPLSAPQPVAPGDAAANRGAPAAPKPAAGAAGTPLVAPDPPSDAAKPSAAPAAAVPAPTPQSSSGGGGGGLFALFRRSNSQVAKTLHTARSEPPAGSAPNGASSAPSARGDASGAIGAATCTTSSSVSTSSSSSSPTTSSGAQSIPAVEDPTVKRGAVHSVSITATAPVSKPLPPAAAASHAEGGQVGRPASISDRSPAPPQPQQPIPTATATISPLHQPAAPLSALNQLEAALVSHIRGMEGRILHRLAGLERRVAVVEYTVDGLRREWAGFAAGVTGGGGGSEADITSVSDAAGSTQLVAAAPQPLQPLQPPRVHGSS